MNTINRHGIKFLSDEDLAAQHQQDHRIRWRTGFSVICGLLGFACCLMAAVPLLANQAVPLNWVYEANQHGLTEALRENGLRLLANGRIQVIPDWLSWLFGSIGTLLLWGASLLFVNRKANKWYGSVLSPEYWMTFYLVKRSEITLRVVKGARLHAPDTARSRSSAKRSSQG